MTPVVSVCIISYNQKNFIREAIESALIQEIPFPYEIVISDDCSTDGTKEICLEYSRRFPEKIKFIERLENVGALKNFYNTLQRCRGDYIALLEGDDYWTSKEKLKKQVSFLKKNPDFSICFHSVKLQKGKKLVHDNITRVPDSVTTINDLAWGNYIHTPSCVFRNNFKGREYPAFVYHAPVGDFVLHMLNAQYGKIKCLDEVMAVYRIHSGGMWRSKSQIARWKMWIQVVTLLLGKFNAEVDKILIDKYQTLNFEIYQQLSLDEPNNIERGKYLKECERYNLYTLDRICQEKFYLINNYYGSFSYKLSYKFRMFCQKFNSFF